jgi:uncharacterized protein
MLQQLTLTETLLLILASLGIGFSKSGFAGVSMLHVVIFASVFGAKASSGILLPMLIVGDFCAIKAFGQTVHWKHVSRLLPPTLIGVVLGTVLMRLLEESSIKPIVGSIILGLTALQLYRVWNPKSLTSLPESKWFAWSLGLFAGVATMMANAAGPIVALYLLAVALPKLELVGTGAWLFLAVNLCKLPFSFFALDLISWETLQVNAVFSLAIPVGLIIGAWCVNRIQQRPFNILLLAFTGIAALRLLGLF